MKSLPSSEISLMRHLFTLIFISLGITVSAQPSFVKDSLDNYIKQGMIDWQVPGLSIVIVKDGEIVMMKGYGVKDIQKNDPVDENTLFMIASNTKLFTGIALANLEYRQKLSLNDKITKYFPDFKLYDKTTTELTTIRDLLTHRIGTKTFQGDFTFWNSNLSRKEIMNRMRLLKPVGLFRQDYGYCNSCYLTAGEVIPKVTGQPWEVYVYDSLITAVGMTNTHALSAGISQRKNVASPYTTNYSGTLQSVPYDRWDNLAPAASIVSNVNDLAKWLMFQLDSGKVNGKQVIAWPVLQKTRDVNIINSSRKSSIYPIHFRGYGLGVGVADYNGRQVYSHTGGAAGMVSGVSFIPEERLGIAILTNNDNQNFFEFLRYQVMDAYLGVPYINRSQQQLGAFNRDMQKQLAEIRNWESRTNKIKPSLSYDAYTGEYYNELYGKLTVTKNSGRLKLKFHSHGNLTATMEYMDNDEWLLKYDNIEYGIFAIKFKTDKNKITSVDIKANDFVEYDPYTFIKK
jgi:CubicO group peptidase (beta-lactamase class C family)